MRQRCSCPPDDCAGMVQDYLAGDRAAGDALVRRFTPLVRAIARRVLHPAPREEEDDACQVAFLKVFSGLGSWRGRCPFCKWLAVVASRRILDFAQAARSIPPSGLLPSDLPDPAPPPVSREFLENLERAVSRLPPDWRKAYDLAIEGNDRESIARVLGKSVRTIQYWLAAIRVELQDCVDP